MDEFYSRYSENARTDEVEPHLLSPPDGWPQIFKQSKEMKDFLKGLKTTRVRLVTRPMGEDGKNISKVLGQEGGKLDGFQRAVKLRDALGWKIISGFALWQNGPYDRYIAHERWWNENDQGVWVESWPQEPRVASYRGFDAGTVLVEAKGNVKKPPAYVPGDGPALPIADASLATTRKNDNKEGDEVKPTYYEEPTQYDLTDPNHIHRRRQ